MRGGHADPQRTPHAGSACMRGSVRLCVYCACQYDVLSGSCIMVPASNEASFMSCCAHHGAPWGTVSVASDLYLCLWTVCGRRLSVVGTARVERRGTFNSSPHTHNRLRQRDTDSQTDTHQVSMIHKENEGPRVCFPTPSPPPTSRLPSQMPWRQSIIFDDSLGQTWRVDDVHEASLDLSHHNRTYDEDHSSASAKRTH